MFKQHSYCYGATGCHSCPLIDSPLGRISQEALHGPRINFIEAFYLPYHQNEMIFLTFLHFYDFFSFALTRDTEFQMEIHAVTFLKNRPNLKNALTHGNF